MPFIRPCASEIPPMELVRENSVLGLQSVPACRYNLHNATDMFFKIKQNKKRHFFPKIKNTSCISFNLREISAQKPCFVFRRVHAFSKQMMILKMNKRKGGAASQCRSPGGTITDLNGDRWNVCVLASRSLLTTADAAARSFLLRWTIFILQVGLSKWIVLKQRSM